MDPVMTLVIGWTMVGAFVFTASVTCLSLVGWVRFADKRQQNALVAAVVVQLVVGAAGTTVGKATFSPKQARDSVANVAVTEVLTDLLETHNSETSLTRGQAEILVSRISAKEGSRSARENEELMTAIRSLPAGRISSEDAAKIISSPPIKRVHDLSGEAIPRRPHQSSTPPR